MYELLEIMILFVIGITVSLYISKNRIIYHGPNSKDYQDKIFFDKISSTYYKLIPKVHICPEI